MTRASLMQAIAHRLGPRTRIRARPPTKTRPLWILAGRLPAARGRCAAIADGDARAAGPHRPGLRSRGLATPAGYVHAGPRAGVGTGRANVWRTRRQHTSSSCRATAPLGFRLPLESLDYIPPSRFPYAAPQDPTEPRAPLPDPDQLTTVTQSRAARPLQQPVPAHRPDRPGSPHRLRGRAARRGALRVHAAGRPAGRLPGTARPRSRVPRRDLRPAGPYRGLRAALRPPPRRDQGDARPRRDRGQRPARDRAGTTPSTITRGRLRGCARRAARRRQVP